MAIRYGNSIDLTNNQILNVRLQNLAADPSSTNAGTIYYNTATSKIRFYNSTGSTWVEVGSASVTNITGTSPIVVTPSGTSFAVSIPAAAGPSTNGYMLGSDKALLDGATASNTPNMLVERDSSGNFSAGTITASMVTGLSSPVNASDAVNKGYVDASRSGLDVKDSVRVASTGNIAGTYNPTGGTSGRGQFTTAPNSIDGVALVAGNRILVKDQTVGGQNGIYVVTTLGTGSNGVWDRASDFDTDGEVTAGAFTFVEEGTVNADSGYVLTTNNPITLGGSSGTSLAFAQFSGAGTIIAGNGINKSGNTISVVASPSGGLTVDGTGVAITSIPASVQTSITQLGTITTGTWNATAIGPIYGGTGITSYALGDIIYASGSNTLAKLSGNTTTNKRFLTQTGTGSVSASPAWSGIAAADYPVFIASGPSNAQGAVPAPGSSAGTTKFLREDATWAVPPNSGGTVTQVALAAGSTNGANAVFTISGSPINGSGTLTFDFSTQTQGLFLASPTGSTGAPSFRGIASTDLPVVPISKGGTGGANASAARTNLAADITPTSPASGSVLPVKMVFLVGDGSATTYTFTHNYGHRDIQASLIATATPWDIIYTDITYPTTNTVTVTFGAAVASGAYRLVLIG